MKINKIKGEIKMLEKLKKIKENNTNEKLKTSKLSARSVISPNKCGQAVIRETADTSVGASR